MDILPLDFYRRTDTIRIAKELLGKALVTRINGRLTSGIIVETEAYTVDDKACHAYGYRRTARTEILYSPGGLAYIYLCYGIHHLFNVVTNVEDEPAAVLVRAVEPIEGLDLMLRRRKMAESHPRLTAGPGALTQALGLKTSQNGSSLLSKRIQIADIGLKISPRQILASPRVGVGYAGEDAKLPWRFRIKDNPWTSPAK